MCWNNFLTSDFLSMPPAVVLSTAVTVMLPSNQQKHCTTVQWTPVYTVYIPKKMPLLLRFKNTVGGLTKLEIQEAHTHSHTGFQFHPHAPKTFTNTYTNTHTLCCSECSLRAAASLQFVNAGSSHWLPGDGDSCKHSHCMCEELIDFSPDTQTCSEIRFFHCFFSFAFSIPIFFPPCIPLSFCFDFICLQLTLTTVDKHTTR